MIERLQILHYNVGRQKHVQWSVLNDEAYTHFAALAVVEPYLYADHGTGEVRCGSHGNWQAFTPTLQREHRHTQFAYRAMIWVNTAYQAIQVPIPSCDIVAVSLGTSTGTSLVISAYDPNSGSTQTENRQVLEQKLANIRQAIDGVRQKVGGEVEIVLCTDFNRYHHLWGGGDGVVPRRRNEGVPLVHFAREYGLQSMLPAGTITWQHIGREQCSSIDVIMASAGLANELIRCDVHEHDHGSDHRPIMIEFDIYGRKRKPRPSRLLPEKADWEQIGLEVAQKLAPVVSLPQNATNTDLDAIAEAFQSVIVTTIHSNVPRARSSPYAKRWWTPELSMLRRALTSSRNRVTTMQRRGEETVEARQICQHLRREFFQAVEKQKRQHWKEFLADPNNIWKANNYARTTGQPQTVPTLVQGEVVAHSDEDKAHMLMATFFPTPPRPSNACETPAVDTSALRPKVPRRLPPITESELTQAIFRQNPKKAPGPDEITFDMWRRLLKYIAPWIKWLYQTSLDLGYVPKLWRTARIVALKKPGKSDYTLPKAYRPISLLPTISKGLESIVAARLSYLAEKHFLLPTNHFGARKQRSCVQALDLLVEKIFEAWKGKRVLSLVTFDVQGAFNGVHPAVLEDRLRERSVPDKMVKWIRSFCEDRTGSVVVGGHMSECSPIAHAGIPQGSPLSPILYCFYNANLVESKISKKGGSLGFIDDFTAWRTGPDRLVTTKKLQEEVLQEAERWSAESGATFEASKTGFIHFERSPADDRPEPTLEFLGSIIRPQGMIKILGVVLDSKLQMTAHIDKIVTAATKKCLALGRLRGLRPRQMRQLHRTVVDTTVDYAASTWYARGRLGVTGHISRLERIQRMGAQAIIGAFRTVASGVLQDEAGLEAVETRLARKTAKHALDVRALPQQHPLWAVMNGMGARNDRGKSPLFATWTRYQSVIEGKKGIGVYPALPYVLPPWHELRNSAFVYDETEACRAHRRLLQTCPQQQLYYTAASARDGWVGTSVVKHHRGTGQASYKVTHQETVGREKTCTATSSDTFAIKTAVEYAGREKGVVWIMTDSKEALRCIGGGGRSKRSREVVSAALRELQTARERGTQVKLLWIPRHKGIAGNELAHRAAHDAPSAHRTPNVDPKRRVREQLEVYRLLQTAVKADIPTDTSRWGKYTYSLDSAAPGKHTLMLYGALTREDAGILAQARTGHTHLRDYLARTRQIASPICECGGGVESVKHVILHCPVWASQRQQLKEVAGDRWSDVSFLLGGKSRRRDLRTGKPVDGDGWRPNLAVLRATIAFLKSTGRFAAQA